MSPRPTVKLDTPVTYRIYLSHRLPPSKKSGTAVGPICNCRTAWAVQVPKSQQHLALRQTLAQAASKMVAGHHALPPDSFSVVVDRAVVLYRHARAASDQNLPGVDIRDDERWAQAEEAARFWTGHGLAVPVWVEFYATTPPDRAHSFTLPGRAPPGPKGNEIAVHQALANEEAQIRQVRVPLTPTGTVTTVGGSTSSECGHSSTGSEDDDET
ncbi:hypothetical protein VM1G_00632 [Cytospora mali]|uniref:Uncharacterized protein n=1 Tax=Cytospora mali TaxID=578113 RepID=A0A194VL51_CYTMA|nr:hypothetical protein VM1G_00632 [Valsa mali]